MKLYRTQQGWLAQESGEFYPLPAHTLDELLSRKDLTPWLSSQVKAVAAVPSPKQFEAPIGTQEVWAAGVTYLRSREARLEEAHGGGGGDFYWKVYESERPELFYKSSAFRVVGPDQPIQIRQDSSWQVPEPEMVLVLNYLGEIVGYTVGNDVSSRDIEGENPLYLPQAKIFDGCCAIGPCILVAAAPFPPETEIRMEIVRDGKSVFKGKTELSQMRRSFDELVSYLFRELSHPVGAMLFTGTGIVPENDFTLSVGDQISIDIAEIGTLRNIVAK
jgi:2-dehydro-3-deoxy-D-arabinonate dehydratase